MIILTICVAGYFLISLTMLIVLTYLDTKFKKFISADNSDIIVLSFAWPFSMPMLIAISIGDLSDLLIDRLRNYFNKDSK